jgi:hypothetical protein
MRKNLKLTAPKEEPLEKIVEHLEEEARMILPGIQALFGFQLIAVFNQRFIDLSEMAQYFHLGALFFSAVAILLVLVPAAYHRQTEPTCISGYFAYLSTKALSLALLALAVGLGTDLYVISLLITHSILSSCVIGFASLFLFLFSWFAFPWYRRGRSQI